MHSMPAPQQDELSADLAIIGAGPVGLFAAYYAGFRGLSTIIIDSLPEPGGQVSALYPEKQIYDIGGFPAVRGQTLVDNLMRQIEPFNPTLLLDHRAEDLADQGDSWLLGTHRGVLVDAKAVLITGGIGNFTPRRLPSAADFQGSGLVYFVPAPEKLTGLEVLIVGGGDSAFDWAVALEGVAKSVVLVHRRGEFRAHQHTVDQVLASSVEVRTHTEVTRLIGDGHIEAAELVDKRTGDRTVIDTQAVVAALGFIADLGPLKEWGLELDKRQIVVDTKMATNLPRVFAAGDITEYPGKVRLIAVGFGEAATAVNNAATEINPSLSLFPGHSSNQ
jgi:ferredoxin/flavodoxin---NADP+ reductase